MNPLYQSIGKRIQSLRKGAQITQEELAEKLDVSIKHVSEVERGVSSYSIDKLVSLSKILDCSMDYLFFGTDTSVLTAALPATIIEILSSGDAREARLLREYLNMYTRLRENEDHS